MGYFQVRYDYIVVIYNHRGFIRFATGHVVMGRDSCSEGLGFESKHKYWIDIFFTLTFSKLY